MRERVSHFVDALIYQWPKANVCAPVGVDFNVYISVDEAVMNTRVWFQSWCHNAKFKEFIGQLQGILDNINAGDHKLLGYTFSQPDYHCCPNRSHVNFDNIMGRSAPSLPPA